nr:Maf family protein [Paracoccaceae bacterium]
VVEGRLLRKAASLQEAIARLKTLAGNTHHLVTGVALVEGGHVQWAHADTTVVRMRVASKGVIEGYCARRGEELLASVSCYEIEGEGAQLIETLEGDVFSALGLPLFPTLAGLRALKALAT